MKSVVHILVASTLLCSALWAGEFKSLISTQLAVATMQRSDDGSDDRVRRSECTVCKGTGKVKGGDGRTVVWRECDNCFDDGENGTGDEAPTSSAVRESEPERPQRMLFFTASWCMPCRRMKENDETTDAPFQILKQKGWEIGKAHSNHIQVFDIDESQDLAQKHSVRTLPTIIVVDRGRSVRHVYGYMDAPYIKRLWTRHFGAFDAD